VFKSLVLLQGLVSIFLLLDRKVGACGRIRKKCWLTSNRIPKGSTPQLSSSQSLFNSVKADLSACPSDAYIVVTQPRVGTKDFRDEDSAPFLRRSLEAAKHAKVQTSYSVANVVGEFDADNLQSWLEVKCDAGIMKVDAMSQFCPSWLKSLLRN
jgi:hypothetical protein